MGIEDAGSLRQFHNRVRIIMNLPSEAFPPHLRADNPTSAGMWVRGGFDRIKAFIHAPDAVADAIWAAMLEYEGEAE